jgi:hypothetical protein
MKAKMKTPFQHLGAGILADLFARQINGLSPSRLFEASTNGIEIYINARPMFSQDRKAITWKAMETELDLSLVIQADLPYVLTGNIPFKSGFEYNERYATAKSRRTARDNLFKFAKTLRMFKDYRSPSELPILDLGINWEGCPPSNNELAYAEATARDKEIKNSFITNEPAVAALRDHMKRCFNDPFADLYRVL